VSEAEDELAMQLDAVGIVFWREVVFAPPRRWRFDLVIDCRNSDQCGLVAVEVEGGSWIQGRHTRGSGFEADCEKYNEATILLWRVLRVTPGMVTDGRALQWIMRLLGRKTNVEGR
jgi:hypothetical protein